MAKVLTWPNEILTRKASPVPYGEKCRELVDSMFDAMDYPNGIGLAAPQIGVDKRIIVVKVPAIKNGMIVAGATKHTLINPEIIWKKGQLEMGYEGCLSFPGERVAVPRWPRIKVRGFTIRWEPVTIGGKGLVARVLQHEIDHLNGITLDHYAKLAKEVLGEQDGDGQQSQNTQS